MTRLSCTGLGSLGKAAASRQAIAVEALHMALAFSLDFSAAFLSQQIAYS